MASMKKCDLTITPEKTNDFGVFDFKKVDELVDVGYQKAIEVLEKVPLESQ
jgi:predicted acylesterase/phospholipase RssA